MFRPVHQHSKDTPTGFPELRIEDTLYRYSTIPSTRSDDEVPEDYLLKQEATFNIHSPASITATAKYTGFLLMSKSKAPRGINRTAQSDLLRVDLPILDSYNPPGTSMQAFALMGKWDNTF